MPISTSTQSALSQSSLMRSSLLQASQNSSADEAFAKALNERCACMTLDRAKLNVELAREFEATAPTLAARDGGDAGNLDRSALFSLANKSIATLFSDTTVFVSAADIAQIAQFVAAHQRITALPGWRLAALNDAPETAKHASAAQGVLMGYDFHLSAHGPQLIEINTNAGGALLNMVLARAQLACCGVADAPHTQAEDAAKLLAMFYAEWRAVKGDAPLRHIAIVDQAPFEQYLLPEFLLFQGLFERAGIRASICDPNALSIVDGTLRAADDVVDLVYNRSTDFAFEKPLNAKLRTAWLEDLAVITPHPQAHALFADKRLLIRLSDAAFLRSIGANAEDIAACVARVPQTQLVLAEHSDLLWQSRREWFFKPADGFGGKATYRGDKLTRRVFEEILRGNYVAQRIVAPSVRVQNVDGAKVQLKSDLRAYSYAGKVLLYAARLYQGQTTNFRTPGGGFASVVAIPEVAIPGIASVATTPSFTS